MSQFQAKIMVSTRRRDSWLIHQRAKPRSQLKIARSAQDAATSAQDRQVGSRCRHVSSGPPGRLKMPPRQLKTARSAQDAATSDVVPEDGAQSGEAVLGRRFCKAEEDFVKLSSETSLQRL
ncbi:hypothetical protein PYW07_002907 [Mythimna separata]|uniref:Uncharacterized protein n=1 Tax=Mythimna separata TaxID=271217 RepID=A0AAD8DPV7_MYTSE|nr:hypothetical protein PYW07_002907 [Mythimna separata]